MGSGAGVEHFALVGKWVIDRPGMGIDVDCIVAYAKVLPTLLPLDQHEVGRALHLLCPTYHPTFHKLVQLTCHPLALTLVEVSGGVVATHMWWHLNIEPEILNTSDIMLPTSDAIFKSQEVLPQPRPLLSGCHLPLDGLESNPALLPLPGGTPHSRYTPLTQLPVNSSKIWKRCPNIVQ